MWVIHRPQISEVLLRVHALQPDLEGRCEPFQARYLEAQCTIRSAFSQRERRWSAASVTVSARFQGGVGTPMSPVSNDAVGVPNAVREILLSQGLGSAARVLDGFYMAGLKPGALFTERQACELLRQYGIGRRSIMVALKVILQDGARLFVHAVNSLHTTPEQAIAAKNIKAEEKKCLMSSGANRVKTSGRPPVNYILPGNPDLAQRLGIVAAGADQLNQDDLASPAMYRRALHRELIKRRPGQYARYWLAKRLGISVWTCRRYEGET